MINYRLNHPSPKCYYINQGKTVKRSNKGTPKHIDLEYDDYEKALFNDEIKKATFNRISVEKKIGAVATRKITKRALNNIYTKLHVEEDLVTVRPHMKNDKYL